MSTPVWSEDTLRGALRVTAKTECQAIGVEWDQLRSLIESHLELHRQLTERDAQLDGLRSAVRSLFTPGGRMVSAAPGTYRNLWSLVANNTDTCRGPDGQATRTETNQ